MVYKLLPNPKPCYFFITFRCLVCGLWIVIVSLKSIRCYLLFNISVYSETAVKQLVVKQLTSLADLGFDNFWGVHWVEPQFVWLVLAVEYNYVCSGFQVLDKDLPSSWLFSFSCKSKKNNDK